MGLLTDHILNKLTTKDLDAAFRDGATSNPDELKKTRNKWASVRSGYGFSETYAPLITIPSSNAKLDKGSRPAYGLTIQHHSVKISGNLRVNACPWAGHCTKVCVLDTGNGLYPRVQMARIAKTAFLAKQSLEFMYLLGSELSGVADKEKDQFDFRPNVNSDVEWERLVPSMLDGSVIDSMWTYGYSKNPAILYGNGWVTPKYRVAFSANERMEIDAEKVSKFLSNGGSVAVVTNRLKKEDVAQWNNKFKVVNADLTDEWLWESGVIGDLSAKGKARKLIDKSKFVHVVSF